MMPKVGMNMTGMPRIWKAHRFLHLKWSYPIRYNGVCWLFKESRYHSCCWDWSIVRWQVCVTQLLYPQISWNLPISVYKIFWQSYLCWLWISFDCFFKARSSLQLLFLASHVIISLSASVKSLVCTFIVNLLFNRSSSHWLSCSQASFDVCYSWPLNASRFIFVTTRTETHTCNIKLLSSCSYSKFINTFVHWIAIYMWTANAFFSLYQLCMKC